MKIFLFFTLTVLLLTSCKNSETSEPEAASKEDKSAAIARVVASEDLLLDFSPHLENMGAWMQLCLDQKEAGKEPTPPPGLKKLVGLAEDTILAPEPGQAMTQQHWPISESPQLLDQSIHPWRILCQQFENPTEAKFGVLSATLPSPDKFVIKTVFSAKMTREGSPYGINATQSFIWSNQSGNWQFVEWIQHDLTLTSAPFTLFRDTLPEAIPDEDTLEAVLTTDHDQYLTDILLHQLKPSFFPDPIEHFPFDASYNFPSVSVVDFDGDSHEDLFLTSRWDPSQLLRNRGDGTFEDVTDEAGLRNYIAVNCSLFADFDNDDDQDCLIGFSWLGMKLYFNNNGKFTLATDNPFEEARMVTGLSVSDINRDGILDVYISTNCPDPAPETKEKWHSTFLKEDEVALFEENSKDANKWLNKAGPPNYLFMGVDGKTFRKCSIEGPWSQWHMSYQSAWGDYDNDGDDDLYICNDFAPDAFLRNDTPKDAAEPIFTDVTVEALGDTHMGFGMGVDWGDYDRDGDLDLYVSNMYSKAGKRILAQLGEQVGKSVKVAAAGNFLYQNYGAGFLQSAGSGENQMNVHRAGWSYGGQFADFDNNGELDLYVPCGHYTAPKTVTSQVDL